MADREEEEIEDEEMFMMMLVMRSRRRRREQGRKKRKKRHLAPYRLGLFYQTDKDTVSLFQPTIPPDQEVMIRHVTFYQLCCCQPSLKLLQKCHFSTQYTEGTHFCMKFS